MLFWPRIAIYFQIIITYTQQVGKLFKPSVFYYGNYDYDHPYTFDNWNRNAQVDGWVCRSDRDCEWIDPFLGCDDREFQLNRVQVKVSKIFM